MFIGLDHVYVKEANYKTSLTFSKNREFENQLNDCKGSKITKSLIEVVSCIEKSNDTYKRQRLIARIKMIDLLRQNVSAFQNKCRYKRNLHRR